MKLYIITDKETGAKFVSSEYTIETIEAEFIESDGLACNDCVFGEMHCTSVQCTRGVWKIKNE